MMKKIDANNVAKNIPILFKTRTSFFELPDANIDCSTYKIQHNSSKCISDSKHIHSTLLIMIYMNINKAISKYSIHYSYSSSAMFI